MNDGRCTKLTVVHKGLFVSIIIILPPEVNSGDLSDRVDCTAVPPAVILLPCLANRARFLCSLISVATSGEVDGYSQISAMGENSSVDVD